MPAKLYNYIEGEEEVPRSTNFTPTRESFRKVLLAPGNPWIFRSSAALNGLLATTLIAILVARSPCVHASEGEADHPMPPSGSAVDPRNFSADRWLPGYHFVPYPFDWQNDPNGPMYDPVHEVYHLFYQYRTPRIWGHAISYDLVDWIQLPPALYLEEWYDSGGDYSGSATVLNDPDRSVVLSVSSSTEEMFLAMPSNRSDPFLVNWTYVGGGPIVSTAARDPTELLYTEDGNYQMFIGTFNGTEVWQCDNFTFKSYPPSASGKWYLRGLAQPSEHDYYWECPDIFELPIATNDKKNDRTIWIGKYSRDSVGDYYQLGTYDSQNAIFTPRDNEWKMYDENILFYASKSFDDSRLDRRILWGWLHMIPGWPHDDDAHNFDRDEDDRAAAETDDWWNFWEQDGQWQNAQGVPRIIEVVSGGSALRTYPIPELQSLRRVDKAVSFPVLISVPALDSSSGDAVEAVVVSGAQGRMLDIDATVRIYGENTSCGLRVLCDLVAGEEYVEILTNASSSSFGRQGGQNNSSFVEKTLRIMVDASIVEAFFDEGMTASQTFFSFPMLDTSVNVMAVAKTSNGAGGSCDFTKLTVYPMSPFKFTLGPGVL